MKSASTLYYLFALISLTVLTNCKEDELGSNQLLEGVIGGEKWVFKFGKANFNSIDNIYDIEFYSTLQTQDDPCTIISTANAYISVQLPNQIGTYTLPFGIQSQTLKFNLKGTSNDNYAASSGFIEISIISGGRIGGYIFAEFDEDNKVEGNFVMERCN
jgi:hypothetical protein